MSSNGNGEGAEIDRPAEVVQDANVVDVSIAAVNARLSAFVSEHKAALAKGDPRALRESDMMLAAMAESALAQQAEAEEALAQAEAKLERLELDRRGGRVQ